MRPRGRRSSACDRRRRLVTRTANPSHFCCRAAAPSAPLAKAAAEALAAPGAPGPSLENPGTARVPAQLNTCALWRFCRGRESWGRARYSQRAGKRERERPRSPFAFAPMAANIASACARRCFFCLPARPPTQLPTTMPACRALCGRTRAARCSGSSGPCAALFAARPPCLYHWIACERVVCVIRRPFHGHRPAPNLLPWLREPSSSSHHIGSHPGDPGAVCAGRARCAGDHYETAMRKQGTTRAKGATRGFEALWGKDKGPDGQVVLMRRVCRPSCPNCIESTALFNPVTSHSAFA